MKLRIRTLAFLLICNLLLLSCKKDFEIFIPQSPETSAPGALRQGDVAGIVRTGEGAPLSAATVRVPGAPPTTTTEEGLFRMRRVAFTERYFALAVHHEAYLPMTVFAGSSRQGLALTDVVLLEPEATEMFHTSVGYEGTVRDATVRLPRTALVTATGAVFSGQARLRHAAWEDDEALSEWPLPLAEGSAGLQFVLPAGMWAFFLDDAGGTPLELRTGFRMQVRLSPNAARPFTPYDGMPLWHFDPETGLWQEAAVASAANHLIEAELPATGYWMAGRAVPATWLAGVLQTAEMVPLPQMNVEVALADGMVIDRLTTQSDGSFVAYVPAGELLKLTFTDACGQVVYEGMAGPLQTPTRLAPFTASAPSARYVQGRLRDCAGEAMGGGIRIVEPERVIWLQSEPDGLFHGFGAPCQAPWVELQAVDPATGLQSEPLVLRWTDEVALPPLSLCLEDEEYVFVGVDGMREQLITWAMASDDGSWQLAGIAESGENLSINAAMVTHEGTYDLSGRTAGLGSLGVQTIEQGQLVIREWSAVPGGRVSGYWWARLTANGKPAHFTGSFRLMR